MAQKQYSFDFVLNAVLNGGFSGTFTKAQQEFIRLGAEIKNLQAIQRDVKAYEKQAAAVQNTSQKLENLKRQYELVNRQIGETTGSTTALEREKLKLEQRIANTEGALEKQRQKLDETKDRLDAAGVSTDNLAEKDAALTEKIKELTEEQKRAAEGAGEFGSVGVQAIEAVGGAIAAAGIAEAVKGIADAYEECVGVAGDFEQAMSAVEAIAEANRSELAALKAEAKELGATTIYTAQQSAKSMEYMSMAGWDAQEMLAGMAGMTNLAAAAGEDLAQVSDIVTDNLSAFKLQASDTAHFADVLAAAAANSNTNIAIMGETFKNSSSVAGALGYSIEDVAVMVGLMANNAAKGSRAGTALRNIFNGLLGGVTLTAEAFGELEYSAVNSDGSMKGLMETVKDLRGYFDQMTEAERVNNAMTIAGMRGYNGLLAILDATDENFQSLYNSVNNCTGAAQRMASVKLDNLNGDITLMNSAMEALQSTIGEQFNPELRELTRLKTELLNGLNTFVQEEPALTKGIMAGAGAFGLMASAIVGVNAAIKVYRTLKAAEIFAAATPAFLTGAAALAVVTAGVYSGISAQKEMVAAYDEVLDAHRKATDFYQDSIAEINGEADATSSLIEQLRELSGQSEKTEADHAKIAEIVRQLNTSIPELNLAYNKESGTLSGLTGSVDNYVKSLYEAKKAERDIARSVELYGSIQETEAALADAQEELDKLLAQYDGIVSSGGDTTGISNAIDVYRTKVYQLTQQLAEEQAEYDSLSESTKDYYDAQNEAAQATDNAGTAIAGARAKLQELTKAYKEAYEEAKKSFEGQFGLFDEAKAEADATVQAAQTALDTQLAYWQGYAANIAALKKISAEDLGVTKENYDALMEYVRSGTPEAAGLAASMVREINKGNTQALTDLANTLGEISENQKQAERDVAEWTVGLTEQMNQFIQSMEEEIGQLDLSEEAKEYGRMTVQGYVDAATSAGMSEQVRRAYASVAAAARTALAPVYSDSAYYANNMRGYASGTDNAPPGWSWVGEDGPELMRLHGGEQILPNSISQKVAKEYDEYKQYAAANGVQTDVSQRVAEDYSAYNNYAAAQGVQQTRALEVVTAGTAATAGAKVEVHVHVEAGALPETVDAWQDYARRGELKAVVLEVMEDAEADARRRAMT